MPERSIHSLILIKRWDIPKSHSLIEKPGSWNSDADIVSEIGALAYHLQAQNGDKRRDWET